MSLYMTLDLARFTGKHWLDRISWCHSKFLWLKIDFSILWKPITDYITLADYLCRQKQCFPVNLAKSTVFRDLEHSVMFIVVLVENIVSLWEKTKAVERVIFIGTRKCCKHVNFFCLVIVTFIVKDLCEISMFSSNVYLLQHNYLSVAYRPSFLLNWCLSLIESKIDRM